MRGMQEWSDKTIRLQDKGGRFVVLNNTDYTQKVQDQINCSHLTETETDLSSQFENEIKQWQEKWKDLRKLPKEWITYTTPSNPKPGTMYGLIKTHKPNNTNPARTISSGCGTSSEYLSIFVETHLAPIADKLESRIKDSSHLLDIIDKINSSPIPGNPILASLDVVNMFPNIDNVKGIADVTAKLNLRTKKDPPTTCIIEALRICLQCNNTTFNKKHYLQTDGTAQGPHMACSYSDIAMDRYDQAAKGYHSPPFVWFRFRDDIFIVWIHGIDELHNFVTFMNEVDETHKMRFLLQVGTNNSLNFNDLTIEMDPTTHQLTTDIYAKPTNTFTYVNPNTCYPKRNIENIPFGVALRLRRICDTDDKFNDRSEEYSNYFIARGYKPSKVDQHFNKAKNISRQEARTRKPKQTTDIQNALITNYNPALPNIHKIINNNLHILQTDPAMRTTFPPGSIKPIYRRHPNLKEILSPSRFPCSSNKNIPYSANFCNRCDLCKNFIVQSPTFRCSVTGTVYKIRGHVSCQSTAVIYLITCKECWEQYVGSTENFKPRIRIHKSDNLNNNATRCGAARHFNGKCKNGHKGVNDNMQVQIIEIIPPNKCNDEYILKREQYWQAQLFTISHGMNSKEDWYSSKRKGYRIQANI